jgi:hypothetical protein
LPRPNADSQTATAVTVNLVYLARLREAFGRAGEPLILPGNEVSVTAILAALRARGGAFAAELAPAAPCALLSITRWSRWIRRA